ncbi:RagB/SusD family nutrient uptake outer membrane protein [Niabella hibiscisoli]|uniref:RagB/SusD family nutrient uptake outer membrane protein n=1 Tax=Niabella hibiscisoli TaxID=1825928 RepID=UPI001F0ED155|nr:RagB/SusD family nutrient uptake outer membrane protein [Niabella hibiscisoli]MCH5719470.1 RagB/SusD family nutrient uptake outer membrane protein [Niabella hibiscisoli]
MKSINKISLVLLVTILLVSALGCKKFLQREPTEILLDDQVWSDPKLALAVLANLYNRIQPTGGFEGGLLAPTDTDEAMWSGGLGGNNARNTRVNFPYTDKQFWPYELMRDLDLFLEKLEVADVMEAQDKMQLLAEARFIRAYVYFLAVRSMGGVPLILKTYQYTGPESVEDMKEPRATESGIYDFIASELDAIKDQMPLTETSKTRANKWTALALKAQAMIYAASIAKYNNQLTEPIQTVGGEVGIPADKANGYYTQALAAAKEIIINGPYSLYNVNTDKGQNFYDLFTKKSGNPEVIWAFDFTLEGKYHSFTVENIPRSLRENATGSTGLVPTLNLVEAFERLDGSSGTLLTNTPNGSDYIYYDKPEDIFEGKDPRMFGTIITPNSTFRGERIEIQAGVMEWNAATNRYVERTSSALNSIFTDGGLLVAANGPQPNAANVTNTGFFLRKYVDSRVGSGQAGQGSDIWWIRYRLGGILLIAAEAAFELNQQEEALSYINRLRERAGFGPNSLSSLDRTRIIRSTRLNWPLKSSVTGI